jgi:hypothetical protein
MVVMYVVRLATINFVVIVPGHGNQFSFTIRGSRVMGNSLIIGIALYWSNNLELVEMYEHHGRNQCYVTALPFTL